MATGCLGVVLRTAPLRESDLLITLYTDEHGRLSAVARGARRSQRRFSGALSLLVLGRYQLGRRPRGDLWSLEAGEVEREWTRLASDPIAVAHASYAAELVGALLPPEAPDPHALAVILDLWDCLADGGPSPAALRSVELSLLELAGHGPALDHCAACREPDLASGALFDPARGGAICRRCAARSRGAGTRVLPPESLRYLGEIAARSTPTAARPLDADPRFPAAVRTAARDALVAMVSSLVDKPLRSLEYIAKLGAGLVRRDTP